MSSNVHKVLVGFLPSDYPGVEAFESLGDVTYRRYTQDWLKEHIPQFHIVVPHLFEHISSELIEIATNLRVMATPSTGSDHIDTKALANKGVKFVSLNDDRVFIDGISSTAELSWMLTLACARRLPELLDRVNHEQSWVNTDIRGMELRDKTIGIIGYGRLGKKVARYANAFQMKVLIYDIDPDVMNGAPQEVEAVPLSTLLAKSDIVSLHPKLNETSRGMIAHEQIAQMKDGVIIINTARGAVLDSKAALDGVQRGKIAALGLDVLNNEYQSAQLPNDPLITAARSDSRIIVTPHAGGSTYDAHAKVFSRIAELIAERFEQQ
ncbi:D-3-phosphoglycerate dehydrogenase [Alkalispirochaeta americana]|uniref:D-3-phosphoglycerate dehydrogenase n=1 Tax=Alkalispirochaeta americana TaxID=159291 RepID=A0A1N6XSW0_9SPIO|nr:NAD(P)-dependent oxidoreductase [Alkalispirochaeta americana]SIR05281.1 D-3-phosphoglycerate dehydrogenase [Alkalispirochaeta americana]